MIFTTIGFGITDVATTFGAATPAAGDSFDIQTFDPRSPAKLIGICATHSGSALIRVTAPSFSDTTRGLQMQFDSLRLGWISSLPIMQHVQPTETLDVQLSAIAASTGDGPVGALILCYSDLPGRMGYYLDRRGVMQRAIRQVTVQGSLAPTARGTWTGAEAINADSDLLRTQRPYAVVGLTVAADVLGVGIRAPDWSNERNFIPKYYAEPEQAASHFLRLSDALGRPAVPVFNSGNKASVFLDTICRDGTLSAFPFTLHLVELSGEPQQYAARRMMR